MTDLAEFLAARLDEDESAAKGAQEEWDADWVRYEREDLPDEVYNHVVRHDPARVLREVQAKRTLLRYFTDLSGEPVSLLIGETIGHLARGDGTVLPVEWIFRELAAVWSDHPDYRAEWKP